MQTAADFLHLLRRKGVTIWAEHGELHVRALPGSLLPDEKVELRSLKADLLHLLQESELPLESAILPRKHDHPIPLTSMQRRLWERSGTSRESARIFGVALRIFGPLNIDCLQMSIETVLQRHEALRTRFVSADGIPRQCIDSPPNVYDLDTIDLKDRHSKHLEEGAKCVAKEFTTRTVSFCVGPLFEAKLLKLSELDHILVLALDHMITDGVSNRIINSEIWISYEHYVNGQPPRLPKVDLQFADYAVWQHRTYRDWLQRHAGYWKARLENAPPTVLSPDYAGIEVPIGARFRFSLGSQLSSELKALAMKEKTLLALLVFSTYVVVMSRWCRQRDLILTFVSNARWRGELENVVGFLASQMYLRIEIAEGDTLLDLTKRVAQEYSSAYDHFDFDRIPDLAPTCSTDLHFNWYPHPYQSETTNIVHNTNSATDGIRVEPFRFGDAIPYKFGAWAAEIDAQVSLSVQYRPDLFTPATIESFRYNFRLVAEELVRRPGTLVSSISSRMR